METISIGYALLAIQSALLGVITPELRAVVVDVNKEDDLFYIRFFYDGAVSENFIDLWECAIAEASADLGPNCLLDAEVERLDYPLEIPCQGRYAYLRQETYSSINPLLLEARLISHREIVDLKDTGVFVNPVDGESVTTRWGVIYYAQDSCHIVPAKPENYKIKIFPLAYALLAIQRGLLGVVTPELRSVIADISQKEKLFYIRFFYDGQISNRTIDNWECAITKALADLGTDYLLDAAIERLDYPLKVPFRGRYAYLRKE